MDGYTTLYIQDPDDPMRMINSGFSLKDGHLYLNKKGRNYHGYTNVKHLISQQGDINIFILKTLFSRIDSLCNYINKLEEKNGDELKQLDLKDPLEFYGMSRYDFARGVLRFLYNDILKDILEPIQNKKPAEEEMELPF
jgi:hypothetical protein